MALGLLSFILFEVAVLLFTTFSGSVLAVMGVLALLLQIDSVRTSLTTSIKSPIVLPMLVLVPAVIGLVYQHQKGAIKATKKPSGSAPPPKPAGAVPKAA